MVNALIRGGPGLPVRLKPEDIVRQHEEIDALSTLGIPPMEFLVLPRMLALVIMMPLLIFIFWIGIYPNTFLDKMNPALENMIKEVKGKQHIAMMAEGMDQTVTQITVND